MRIFEPVLKNPKELLSGGFWGGACVMRVYELM